MRVTMDVKYGQSYAMAEGLTFRSLGDALAHCAEPWNVEPLSDPSGSTPYGFHPGRSYWPCHGDWSPGDTVAFIFFGTSCAGGPRVNEGYPDRIVTVGARGGLKLEHC